MSHRTSKDRRDDREATSSSSSKTAPRRQQLNEYWIDGDGINRQVLQSEICKYLGAEATCRPGDYNGRPGYKIKAIRTLTPEMVEDLKALSQQFASENRSRRGEYREELSYEESQTRYKSDTTAQITDYPPSTSAYSNPSASYYDNTRPNVGYGSSTSTYPGGMTGYGMPSYGNPSSTGTNPGYSSTNPYGDPRYQSNLNQPSAYYGHPGNPAYGRGTQAQPQYEAPGHGPSTSGYNTSHHSQSYAQNQPYGGSSAYGYPPTGSAPPAQGGYPPAQGSYGAPPPGYHDPAASDPRRAPGARWDEPYNPGVYGDTRPASQTYSDPRPVYGDTRPAASPRSDPEPPAPR